MGSVYQLKDRPGIWFVSIRRKDIEPILEKFESEGRARAFEKEREASLLLERQQKSDSRSSLPPNGKLDDEVLLQTIGLYKKSASITKRIAKILPSVEKHLKPTETIGKLTKEWMKQFTDRLRATNTYRGQPYAYSTIEKYLVTINIVLKWRADALRVPKPLFSFSVKMFPRGWEGKRKRRLEREEELLLMSYFRKMVDKKGFFWRALVRLALETGARMQELVLAEWSEFRAASWLIPDIHTKAYEDRLVPLTLRAKRCLAVLRALANPTSARVFHCWTTAGVVSGLFSRWKKRLGIVNLNFHDLRHESIARMAISGRDVGAIMEMVGHKTYEMYLRYKRLQEHELKNAILPAGQRAASAFDEHTRPEVRHVHQVAGEPALQV